VFILFGCAWISIDTFTLDVAYLLLSIDLLLFCTPQLLEDVLVHQASDVHLYGPGATAAIASSSNRSQQQHQLLSAAYELQQQQLQLQQQQQQQNSPTSSISIGRTEILLGDQSLRQDPRG